MKKILFLNLIIGSFLLNQAFAESDQIPAGTLRLESSSVGLNKVSKSECNASMGDLFSQVDKMIEKLDREETNGLDYKCSNIYISYGEVTITKTYTQHRALLFVPLPYIPTGDSNYEMPVEIYCEQRTYSEKLALSSLRGCEENPTPECIDFANRLDQVKLTEYIEINKPIKCGKENLSFNPFE